VVGTVSNGNGLAIVCTTAGTLIGGLDGTGNRWWDLLTNGAWIADFYVSTPYPDNGLRRC
jgi:hypothetical protein